MKIKSTAALHAVGKVLTTLAQLATAAENENLNSATALIPELFEAYAQLVDADQATAASLLRTASNGAAQQFADLVSRFRPR